MARHSKLHENDRVLIPINFVSEVFNYEFKCLSSTEIVLVKNSIHNKGGIDLKSVSFFVGFGKKKH